MDANPTYHGIELDAETALALLEWQAEMGVDEPPETLNAVGNLAKVLGAQGKLDEAEALHRRALAGFEKLAHGKGWRCHM